MCFPRNKAFYYLSFSRASLRKSFLLGYHKKPTPTPIQGRRGPLPSRNKTTKQSWKSSSGPPNTAIHTPPLHQQEKPGRMGQAWQLAGNALRLCDSYPSACPGGVLFLPARPLGCQGVTWGRGDSDCTKESI